MSTSKQLDDLVARLQPVRDEELASESRSPSAEALFERIVADLDGAPPSLRPRHDPPRRSRRWIAAGAAVSLVGVAVALAIDIAPAPEAVTPASAALRDAADAARAQDGIAPGKYLYVRSVNASLAIGAVDESDPERFLPDCCEVLVRQVRELWLGDEPGDARLRERRVGELEFLSEEERERWIQLGRPELAVKTPFSGVLAGLPPQWYEGPLDLPSDADAVYEEFLQDAEGDTREPGVPLDVHVSNGMFQHFSDVLREARATPEQRAAAYEALARVPGVVLIGETTDRFGRRGVAVAMEYLDNEPFLFRHVLVFDPETANLLEERREVLLGNSHRGLSAGTIEAYATYEYAVVAALGKRP
jgi:hypothetical protein